MGNFALKYFSICFVQLILVQLGWAQQPIAYKTSLQYEVGDVLHTISPPPNNFACDDGSCAYNRTGGVETFQLWNSHSNRMEIRVLNDYISGTHVFHGQLLIQPPLNDESLFQIFGSTIPAKATLFMLRGFSANGGTLKHYGHEVLATGIYNTWVDVRIVHAQNDYVEVFINDVGVGRWPDTDYKAKNYFKYGTYGSLTTANAQSQWRNVLYYVYS